MKKSSYDNFKSFLENAINNWGPEDQKLAEAYENNHTRTLSNKDIEDKNNNSEKKQTLENKSSNKPK